ncbi:beta-1,4-xylosyltransferase protein [Vigna angularis]|uniref:Glycosyltransferases n=1 Tax=Phaseolus angularis TaxID=3914 RepID=A0A8T0LAD9_PHAAN|nr:beta-1,4-xylosyltransferase protein [Vigna angularis]
MAHIETHRLDGIVYFADDDNIYSLDLFQRMREIRRFGTWTVARLSGDKSRIDPKKWHRPTLEPIRQLDSVSTLIEQLVEDESQMEGLMDNCSRVMVWHIDLESSYSSYLQKWIVKNNLDAIFQLPLLLNALEGKTLASNDNIWKYVEAAKEVGSSEYEYDTPWGKQVGWMYGSTSEDALTGLKIHTRMEI